MSWWDIIKAVAGRGKDVTLFAWLFALTFGLHFQGCKAPAPPAPPPAPISLPASVQGPVGRAIPIEATTDATADVHWWCEDSADLTVRHATGSKGATFVAPRAGKYTVLAWTSIKGQATDAAQCVVTVGDPPPPVPPVPPKPPDPPSPIPSDGFRVLIVHDAKNVAKLKPGQVDALYGSQVRGYLNGKCVKGADGKTPEWRIFDASQDVSNEAKLWKDFMALPRPSLPWIFIANGDKGASQALPDDVAGTMKLLQSIGGQ